MATLVGTLIDRVLEHVLVHYRWIFVCLFLLPLSAVYDLYSWVRNRLVFQLSSAPKQHVKKVAEVQKQVRQWRDQGSQVPMCTARPGWQTMSFRQGRYKKTLHKVAINMVDVLEINVEKKTVRVEPLVTIGQLTGTLDPLGWTLPIVPELDDLTVGGMVNGTGIESSSHKYGLLQHICVSFELVLADGSAVTCSKDENPDLFYAVPWSHGTLGFLTCVELKIIEALRFVRLEYHPVHSLNQAVQIFQEQAELSNNNQFVEGIMFNCDQGVIMTGNMVSSAEPGKLNNIGLWYKPWFYKHVLNFLKTGQGVEYIPLRDYHHRHTKSIFWELQDIVGFGNSPLFRYSLGWLMPPKVSLLKLTQCAAVKRLYETKHVLQDLLIPVTSLKDAILEFDKEIEVYPLWLCPFRLPNNPGLVHPAGDEEKIYVDIGLYGVPKAANYNAVTSTRKIEAFVRKEKGFQMLYADSYLTREEFREMFDHTLYDRLRNRLGCRNAFPEIYDKVSKDARE